MPYITPDYVEDAAVVCRTIKLPSFLLHLVSGALHTLTQESNYEKVGDMLPSDVAEIMDDMFASYLEGSACMVGTIVVWPHDILPDGYVRCDGEYLDPDEYRELFAVLNYRYGYGSGGLFRLPDLRGMVVRGVQNGGESNPQAPPVTGSYGTVVGYYEKTIQDHNLPAHAHSYTRFAGTPALATPGPDPLGVMTGDAVLNTSNNVSANNPIDITAHSIMLEYIMRARP